MCEACADSTNNKLWCDVCMMKERKRDTDHPRRESDSNSRNMVTKDREFVNEGKNTPFRRLNGTVVPPSVSDKSSVDSKFEEKSESQRQNVIALVVIFITSLLVMALLFYNFPELDE